MHTAPSRAVRLLAALLPALMVAAIVTSVAKHVFAGEAPPPAATPALGASALTAPAAAKKIILIGGKKSHDVGEHDFPNGIPAIAALLHAAPEFAGADVLAYTAGWPADLSVLNGASAIVCYFDGVQEKPEPFNDPARITAVQKLMDAGTGLVCLHQASTVPKDNASIPMTEWLGARRNGMADRTTEPVTLAPATATHPICAGMDEFTYTDEFYPSLIFHHDSQRIVPILRAKLPKEDPKDRIIAWAYERPDGGRGFGFTGGHYLAVFDQPQIRRMLLNAIAWSAHLEVPKAGIATPDPVVARAVVTRADERKVVKQAWGELFWHTSAELKNSRTMTTGTAVLRSGASNPRHFHPNCDEILHVVSGKIRHTMNEVTVEMGPGDTVSIPKGVIHNATNIGDGDAVLAISFDSAYRQAVGY